MNLSVTQDSFTTGAVNDLVAARQNVSQLSSAVARLVNGLPIEQGPIKFRTGTEFVGETKYNDKYSIVVEFKFSVRQTLVLEVGDKYIRFYKDGRLVIKDYAAWETATVYAVGDLVTESGSYYRCLVAHTAGTFADDLDDDYWVETLGANDVAYEIVTPYSENILNELSFTGTADIVYIASKYYAPRKLSRYANDNWLIEEMVFTDGPFLSLNTDPTKTIYLTAGTPPLYTINATVGIFDATNDIGKLFQLQRPETTVGDDGYIAVLRLTTISSATVATGTLISGTIDSYFTDSGNKRMQWRIGAFSGQGVATIPTPAYTILSLSRCSTAWLIEPPIGLWHVLDTYNGKTRWERDAIVRHQIRWTGSKWELWQPEHKRSGYSFASFAIAENDSTEDNPPVGTGPGNGWHVSTLLSEHSAVHTVELDLYDASVQEEGEKVWPAVTGFFQERLYFGSTRLQPSTLFASVIAKHESFAPTNEKNEILDDSGFVYSLSGGNDTNEILWIKGTSVLTIGTSGAEFVAKTPNESEPITPSQVSFVPQSEHGSIENQTVHIVGGQILYVQRLGNILRAIDFDVATGRFKSISLTKFNSTILENIGGYKCSSYSAEPSSVLLMVGANGKGVYFTYDADESVLAWSELTLGGTSTLIESTTVVPQTNKAFYDRYIITKRNINGVAKRYIERFTPEYKDQNYYCYLDCSLSYHNEDTAISTIAGLSHLEGETVQVFGDGEFIVETEVVDGEITLDESYNHIVVGLPYELLIKLLPVEGQLDGSGSSSDKQKRCISVTLDVVKTADVKVGVTSTPTDVVDIGTGIVSGKFKWEVEDDFDNFAGDLFISHRSPYPFTLRAVTREIEFRA